MSGAPVQRRRLTGGLRRGTAQRIAEPPRSLLDLGASANFSGMGPLDSLIARNVSNSTQGKHAVAGRGPFTLIGVGAGLGLIHVLTGPDHISAIVTLSVGGSYRAFCKDS